MNKTISFVLLGVGFFMAFLGLIGSGNIVIIFTDQIADALGADYIMAAPFYSYYSEKPSDDDQTSKIDCESDDMESDDDMQSMCQAQQAFGVLMLVTLVGSTVVTAMFLTGRLQNKMINMGVFGIHALITVLFLGTVLGYGKKTADFLENIGGGSVSVVDGWGPSWSWVFELIGTVLSAVAVFMGEGESPAAG
eukprot:g5138.t1